MVYSREQKLAGDAADPWEAIAAACSDHEDAFSDFRKSHEQLIAEGWMARPKPKPLRWPKDKAFFWLDRGTDRIRDQRGRFCPDTCWDDHAVWAFPPNSEINWTLSVFRSNHVADLAAVFDADRDQLLAAVTQIMGKPSKQTPADRRLKGNKDKPVPAPVKSHK